MDNEDNIIDTKNKLEVNVLKNRIQLITSMFFLIVTMAACSFSVSTAKIQDAYMARDVSGTPEKTTTFSQDEPFYAIVDLANAPDDTTVKASWYAVDAEGVEPNFFIDEAVITSGSNQLTFDLSSDNLWPTGSYKVEITLNDKLDRTLEFSVQ